MGAYPCWDADREAEKQDLDSGENEEKLDPVPPSDGCWWW